MINHNLQAIFIHIPKTGGKTIETCLGADVKKLHSRKREIKHGTPLEWKNPKFWDKYFTFTFARNSWDRLVSTYFCELELAPLGAGGSRRKTIAKLGRTGFKLFVKNHLGKHDKCYLYWQQMSYLTATYDFIGRFENFQEDFDIVCDRIGMPRKKLPHKNKSKHKHYTEYYDDETREIVAEKYAKDIEYFGYKFGQ